MSLQPSVTVITVKGPQVKLRVANNTKDYQLFHRMNCSWEADWRCDNPGIAFVGYACAKNFMETHILPPGAVYEEKAWPIMVNRLQPGPVAVRFGLTQWRHTFSNAELERIYRGSQRHRYFFRTNAFRRFRRETDTFWTPPVTIVIRKEWIAK